MTATGLSGFDTTVQETYAWIKGLMERLDTNNRHHAYAALRGTLHALRDRLGVENNAHLSAQLPMLVRGIYYEGWRPGRHDAKDRHLEQFLAHIAAELGPNVPFSAEEAASAVFNLMEEKIDTGEIYKIVRLMPHELQDLWQPADTED